MRFAPTSRRPFLLRLRRNFGLAAPHKLLGLDVPSACDRPAPLLQKLYRLGGQIHAGSHATGGFIGRFIVTWQRRFIRSACHRVTSVVELRLMLLRTPLLLRSSCCSL